MEERSFRNALSIIASDPPHLSNIGNATKNVANMTVTKVSTNSTVGLSMAAKEALHKLLHELSGFADASKEDCLAYVKNLTRTVDFQCTDLQLKFLLQHECLLAKEFPKSHSTNFKE